MIARNIHSGTTLYVFSVSRMGCCNICGNDTALRAKLFCSNHAPLRFPICFGCYPVYADYIDKGFSGAQARSIMVTNLMIEGFAESVGSLNQQLVETRVGLINLQASLLDGLAYGNTQ